MPCLKPRDGYRSHTLNPNTGKFPIVWSLRKGFHDLPEQVPCGQCIGCRLGKSADWAVRAVHEASLYEDNCFVTLTYSDEHLPIRGSLNYDHPVTFMKDLRNKVYYFLKKRGFKTRASREPFDIRAMGCGEYGEQRKRPHYHLCLFNYDFPDKVPSQKTKLGHQLYTSQILSEIWPYGLHQIGDLTFESAAYVARYVVKKFTGKNSSVHYERHDPFTGEIYELEREKFCCLPRKKGLGKPWLEKYFRDVYPHDEVILGGKTKPVPRYYDRLFEMMTLEKHNLFELEFSPEMEKIKRQRKRSAKKHAENNTTPRLLIREESLKLKSKLLIRGYESHET